MAKTNAISPAEWQVMRVVWTAKTVTSAQACDLLTAKMGWKPATVKTLLRRLVTKGALVTTKDGRTFRYRALIPEQETMNQAADELIDSMCQMHVGQTLAHLLERAPLAKGDVPRLMAILEERAHTAPDRVPCDCLPKQECPCDTPCPDNKLA